MVSKLVAVLTFCGWVTLANATSSGIAFASGVVDTRTNLAFIAHIPDGIDAINLSQGTIIWHTADADRPVFLHESKLVALKKTSDHAVQVIVLDAGNKGAVVSKSEVVGFPKWSTVTMQNDEEFAVSGEWIDNSLRFKFFAKSKYQGGASANEAILKQYVHEAHWLVEVDLKTGRAISREISDKATFNPASLSNSVAAENKLFEVITEKVASNDASYHFEKKMRAKDASTGGVLWQADIGGFDAPRSPKLRQ